MSRNGTCFENVPTNVQVVEMWMNWRPQGDSFHPVIHRVKPNVSARNCYGSVVTLLKSKARAYNKIKANRGNWRQRAVPTGNCLKPKSLAVLQSHPCDLSKSYHILNHIRNTHLEGSLMGRAESGWVKLHRKMEDDIAKNFLLLGLWTTLIRWANYRESRVSWKGLPRELKRGEVLTSETELAREGEVNRRTVHKYLLYLEKRGSISIERSPLGSKLGMIITLLNYDKYNTRDAVGSHDDTRDHTHEGSGTVHTYKESKKERREEGPSAAEKFEFRMKEQDWFKFFEEIDLKSELSSFGIFISRRFQSVDKFREWIESRTNGAYQELPNIVAKKSWLIVAIKSECGLMPGPK